MYCLEPSDLLPTLEKETVRSHYTCILHYYYYLHCLVIRSNCSYCPGSICVAVSYGRADRTMLDTESGEKFTETSKLFPKKAVTSFNSRLVMHLAEVNKCIMFTH